VRGLSSGGRFAPSVAALRWDGGKGEGPDGSTPATAHVADASFPTRRTLFPRRPITSWFQIRLQASRQHPGRCLIRGTTLVPSVPSGSTRPNLARAPDARNPRFFFPTGFKAGKTHFLWAFRAETRSPASPPAALAPRSATPPRRQATRVHGPYARVGREPLAPNPKILCQILQ
jgi:hypothetical protein